MMFEEFHVRRVVMYKGWYPKVKVVIGSSKSCSKGCWVINSLFQRADGLSIVMFIGHWVQIVIFV